MLPEDASTRLMRMLESVRLEKTDPFPDPHSNPQRTDCPQCHSETPWGTSSWCPDCGYYPKLGRAMTPGELDPVGNCSAPISFQWMIWLGLGIVVLTAASFGLRVLLPEESDRGGLGRIQFIVGSICLMLAQLRAYMVATHGTDSIPISSIFFEPFQLWPPVFKQLPKSRRLVYFAGWGLTCMMLALMVTGMDFNGMFSNMKPKKPKKNLMQTLVQVISAADQKTAFSGDPEMDGGLDLGGSAPAATGGGAGNGDLEGAIGDFSGAAGGNISGDPQAALNDSTAQIAANFKEDPEGIADTANQALASMKEVPVSPSGQVRSDRSAFLIFGYLTNPAGEIRSILLADVHSHRPRFAGKLSLDEIPESQRNQIQQQLDQLRSPRAAMRTSHNARWVHPVLIAHVAYVGWTPEGSLREGYLVQLEDSREQKSLSGTTPTLPHP